MGDGLTEANTGDIFVRLKDGSRPSTEEVMNDIRKEGQEKVPGLDVDVSQLMEDMIGDLVAMPEPTPSSPGCWCRYRWCCWYSMPR